MLKTMPQTSEKGMIRVESLAKHYGPKVAVFDVSLTLKAGEIVGLLGPNGAGKTTTFYMVVGLVPETSGRVFLDGQNITAMPMWQRARSGLGYLPQEASIFRKLTVWENVMAVVETLNLNAQQRHDRTAKQLLDLGLDKLAKQPAFTLSGGERRRLEIARALATGPRFLLMDEPFSALDAQTREIMQTELLRIWEQGRKTVLFVTHQIDEAVFLSDRVLVFARRPGRLQESVKIDLPRPRGAHTRSEKQFVDGVERIRNNFMALGILSETPPYPEVAYCYHERGFALASMRSSSRNKSLGNSMSALSISSINSTTGCSAVKACHSTPLMM